MDKVQENSLKICENIKNGNEANSLIQPASPNVRRKHHPTKLKITYQYSQMLK